jgi:hypothetical protein
LVKVKVAGMRGERHALAVLGETPQMRYGNRRRASACGH